MSRFLCLSLALAALVVSVASADGKAPVYCGGTTPFQFRVPAAGKAPEARADAAIEIINKYLGGAIGRVTTKPAGKNVRLLLNNELVALVTPADAAAEKQKSVVALATKWSHDLSRAFDASKAKP
jgi:hypothetical protein